MDHTVNNSATTLVAELQSHLQTALQPHVPSGGTVALIDFPNHDNIGDSLIWLGELAYLRSRGCEIAYACDRTSYSPRRVTRRIGRTGTVLLHGGGNFGDIWQTFQQFRERVVADLQDHPIVQLPQSVHFRDPAAMHRCMTTLDAHPQLVIAVRDMESLRIVDTNFKSPAVLSPDMAFALGQISRTRENPEYDVLWLARTDSERQQGANPTAGPNVLVADWPLDPSHMRLLRYINRIGGKGLSVVDHRTAALAGSFDRLLPLLSRAFLLHASEREATGINLLSNARVVVTDRLHGHILCTLLGVPHVLLDNSYGKLRSFYDAWTHGLPLTRWASSTQDALQQALEWATAFTANQLATEAPARESGRRIAPRT